ncbi:hypothetical protein BDD12DRAFT_882287 [Trichophaea hybrida]|nr:hypothetical protein BDD12DRAFT_882287 [Trichophaea hybrida]
MFAEDTDSESSDLTELDTEDEEVLKEEEVTEEEEEEEEGYEDENEEDEPVSNYDMKHSVIVAASGRPRRGRSGEERKAGADKGIAEATAANFESKLEV